MRPKCPPTVDSVRELAPAGPWPTKSNGRLSVPFAIPHVEALDFLRTANPDDLARSPVDIKGLRMFMVEGIPEGGIGGREFHRIRTEIAVVVSGRLRWTCEDLYRSTKEFTSPHGHALVIPPFVLHTMQAEEPDTALVVLANTLFVPEDTRTHDSYPAEVFRQLQAMPG